MLFYVLIIGAVVASATYVPGKVFDRFVTIWLENQDFTKADSDYQLRDLTKEGILLTQYFGLTHPSQPNYIASIGGDYFGLDHDDLVSIPRNISSVVDLLERRDIEWRGYFEGMPGPGYMGEGSTAVDGSGWDYVRKHNPFVSFDNIRLNGTRLLKLQSFADFQRALTSNNLPQYMHLSPDMLNDGHNTTLEYATNWIQSFLEPLLSNEDFMEKTLILLTYDESETYEIPNQIVSILLGGALPESLRGTKDDTFYTHYSILATLENNWQLPNLGRYDVGANVFDFVASQTGYSNRQPSNMASINNSLSYRGFLNADPALYKPIPPPNLQLIGAGGAGVDDSVKQEWNSKSQETTPYDGSGNIYDGGNGKSSSNAPIYRPQAPGPNFTTSTLRNSATIYHRFGISWAGIGFGGFALTAFMM